MRYRFFYATVFFVSIYTTAISQPELTVRSFIDTTKNSASNYFIIKRNSNIHLFNGQKNARFIRELNKPYFIVSARDTTGGDTVIGRANYLWKFPSTAHVHEIKFPSRVIVSLLDRTAVHDLIAGTNSQIVTHSGSAIELIIYSERDYHRIINNENVVFIKFASTARDESPNAFQDLSVNKINVIHSLSPDVNGKDIVVSVKEKAPDSADIDLKSRLTLSALADDEISLHANQIATIIAGGGNSLPSSKGIAWKSEVVSTSYDNLLPDDDEVLDAHNVNVQNHSYGIGIENFYGPEAQAYDESVVANPKRIHIFSSGNSGEEISNDGPYASIEGFANLTGNMKMAKNLLIVGGHYKDLEVDIRNSRGPAYDGRIKPEVIAYGPEGTSDAAAVVSGTCALLQQMYKEDHGTLPSLDVIKGAIVTTADDTGNEGMDFTTGYGVLNANKAMQVISRQAFFVDTIKNNSPQTFQLDVPSGIAQLRVSLNWIDPPATAGAPTALVNDLDLKLTKVSSGQQWLPWILNSYPHVDSLSALPVRGEDHLNNIELVSLDAPTAGIYEIFVSPSILSTVHQAFVVTYWLDSANTFQWTYPTLADPVESVQEIFFRWDNTFDDEGTMLITLADETYVLDNVDLKSGFVPFTLPDASGYAQAIMKINNVSIDTTEFIVSPAPEINVEFNCDTTAMISWSKIENATTYHVYHMGEKYLEQIAATDDTLFHISQVLSNPYYAVAPIINSSKGLRSAAYNIASQGVNCYYINFFAEATGLGQVRLTLNTSTVYNVESVTWQKFVDSDFLDLATSPAQGNVQYIFFDNESHPGVTRYRAIINTISGETIPTEEAVVYYANETFYAVFPNPVAKDEEDLQVLTDGVDVTISFYNTTGQLVKQQQIPITLFKMNVSDLVPGLYLYSIHKSAQIVASGKVVIK